VDPGARDERVEDVGIAVSLDGFRNRHRLDRMVVLQRVVKAAEELAAGFGEILPCIFAIEDDRHDRVSSLPQNRLRGFLNVMD